MAQENLRTNALQNQVQGITGQQMISKICQDQDVQSWLSISINYCTFSCSQMCVYQVFLVARR